MSAYRRRYQTGDVEIPGPLDPGEGIFEGLQFVVVVLVNGANRAVGGVLVILRDVVVDLLKPAPRLSGPDYLRHDSMVFLISSWLTVRPARESASPRSTVPANTNSRRRSSYELSSGFRQDPRHVRGRHSPTRAALVGVEGGSKEWHREHIDSGVRMPNGNDYGRDLPSAARARVLHLRAAGRDAPRAVACPLRRRTTADCRHPDRGPR